MVNLSAVGESALLALVDGSRGGGETLTAVLGPHLLV
jgi:hypothetical protein